MDPKSQSAANRVYEDFEPDFQWERDERTATLIVQLPGFRRDQLKVQITSTPVVKIIGERQISDNKWRRITKEFSISIPSDCDTNDITAKFERGKLFVKFSIKEASKPQEPDDSSKPREEDKKPEPKPRGEVSEQKETVPEKEKKKEEEEGEKDQEAKKKKKVTTSGVVENIPPLSSEAVTSKNGESSGANQQGLFKRTKTRVLDYTISLKPSFESEDFKQPRKWVNILLLILFAVVLIIYVRQACKSFLEAISKLQG
ncbi:inactive protein RESTRICTED TEV MOVEMENT 2-like [Neltuma alba]|uniref:inactive protein RESTRICTED TEV MOVEMENT 2-like n=1 Tax=Neltuma alba TaxID=207710 RepID=UPI0010A4AD00|nr:inactive protein RESTRICTED TEV MOVEMENT 2-like [Prosopis alba]XP_028801331.1 inactive protein RESTRICTED TEV MOVEMENT 2-like [Prosopis alba]